MTTQRDSLPTIDRGARNLYAAALSGYMRGDLDNLTLDDVFADISDTPDATLFELAYYAWGSYDDLRAHPIDVDERTWHTLERLCVFLTTDLVHEHKRDATTWSTPRQATAWVYLALLTAATAAGLALDWRATAIGWIGLGVAWSVRVFTGRNREPDPTHDNPAWPFADAGQWAEHEHLLDQFELPRWSDLDDSVQVRSSVAEWLFRVQAAALLIVFLPVVLLWTARPQSRRGQLVVDMGVHPPPAGA